MYVTKVAQRLYNLCVSDECAGFSVCMNSVKGKVGYIRIDS